MKSKRPTRKRLLYPGRDIKSQLVDTFGYDSFRRSIKLSDHIHHGFEVVYLEEGETSFFVEGDREYHLRGGEIFIAPPEVRHGSSWKSIQPCTLFWIVFDFKNTDKLSGIISKKMIKSICKAFKKNTPVLFQTDNRIKECFQTLQQYYLEFDRNSSDSYLQSQINVMHLEILLLIYNTLQNSEKTALNNENSLAEVLSYIDENIAEDIAVTDLAKLYGISRGKFHELFKRETGSSPADFIMRKKVEQACVLLKEGDMPITKIAFSLSFSSSQYFANIFKKYTSLSPTSYRKKYV
ncbi:MAG: cupin domain-containing protein [Planctomycetota bacterium]|jgi:AraC-like DNA-binding protein